VRNIDLIFSDISAYYTDGMPALLQDKSDEWKVSGNMRIVRYVGTVAMNYTFRYTNIGGADTTYSADRTVIPGFFVPEMGAHTRPDGAVEQGIFNQYHRKMVEGENSGHTLTCELKLKNSDILDLAYMTDDKDWREAFHIQGYNYRLLELEQLEGNIYRGKFKQIQL